MAIAKPVEKTQDWFPDSNPPPFPDCSVVSHSSMVIEMPTSLTFEIADPKNDNEYDLSYDDEYHGQEANSFPNSACDDSLFLGQVYNNLM